jgi:hypothetical protein
MLELSGVTGGSKTKIYIQATVCRRCVLAVLRTVRLGLYEVGNQANPLTFREKKIVFHNNLEQRFKRKAIDLDIDQTTTQDSEVYPKNARLLPDSCCCLSKKRNEILVRINISPPLTTMAGLAEEGQWLSLLGHRNSNREASSFGATLKP